MKRLLSAILVMAMTIALVPAVFATTGETAAEAVVIEFSSETFFNSDGTSFSNADTVDAGKWTTDTEQFEIVADKTYTSASVRPWNSNKAVSGKKLLWIFTAAHKEGATNNRSLFTIKTKLLKAGYYTVSIKALKASNGAGTYDVLVNDTNIGSFDAAEGATSVFKLATSSDFLEKSIDNVTITPDASGYTEIQFKNTHSSNGYLSLYQIIFTPVAGEGGDEPDVPAVQDEDLTAAFTMDETIKKLENYNPSVVPLTYIDGEENNSNTAVTASKEEVKGVYNMTTSSTDGSYTFLYWVKGLDGGAKKIISRERNFTYSASGTGANYLIAVYEKDGATEGKAEFYNANGQRIQAVEASEEVTTVTIPEIPSIAGFNAATQWGCTDGKMYNPGDVVPISGTMQFVPVYGDQTRGTVSGGQTNSATEPTNGATWTSSQLSYKYAKEGTFTPIVPEGKKFKAWQKDGQIVSLGDDENNTYSFMVWTDCELEALFADKDEEIIYNGPTCKIFVDEFSGNKIMAEFIGFGNDTVVEKGIILTNSTGATEIAMTTTSTQFTVENNIGAISAAGYAIVKNSDGTFTKYIDGTINLTGMQQ